MPHLLNFRNPTVLAVGDSFMTVTAVIGEIGRHYAVSGTEWTITDVILAGGKITLGTKVVLTIRDGDIATSQHLPDTQKGRT